MERHVIVRLHYTAQGWDMYSHHTQSSTGSFPMALKEINYFNCQDIYFEFSNLFTQEVEPQYPWPESIKKEISERVTWPDLRLSEN